MQITPCIFSSRCLVWLCMQMSWFACKSAVNIHDCLGRFALQVLFNLHIQIVP
jgi:hypothetical protein